MSRHVGICEPVPASARLPFGPVDDVRQVLEWGRARRALAPERLGTVFWIATDYLHHDRVARAMAGNADILAKSDPGENSSAQRKSHLLQARLCNLISLTRIHRQA